MLHVLRLGPLRALCMLGKVATAASQMQHSLLWVALKLMTRDPPCCVHLVLCISASQLQAPAAAFASAGMRQASSLGKLMQQGTLPRCEAGREGELHVQ
jgi:hypothetical protein